MEKNLKSGRRTMVNFYFRYLMIVVVFSGASFSTYPHQTQNKYPALRLCMSVCDERNMETLPVLDDNNPYELIFRHFIENTKINKQGIIPIKDFLIASEFDKSQKSQKIQKLFLLNLIISDDMDVDPISVSIHNEYIIKRDNLRKQFQTKTINFLNCLDDKLKIKIELFNDLLKLDEKQDFLDFKDLSINIKRLILKKNDFPDHEKWFDYLSNWLKAIKKEECLSTVVDGCIELNGKFMTTTFIDRLPSVLSIINVLGIISAAVMFLNTRTNDVVNDQNSHMVNGNFTATQLLYYGKEKCSDTAYKFSSMFLENTTDYLNSTIENYFFNMTCLGISQAYTYKYKDLVFFMVAIPFLSSVVYFINMYRSMLHNLSFYFMNRNIELTDNKMINIISEVLEEIPEENLNSRSSLIKSLSSSLGELLKNSHFFSFYEWSIFRKQIKNSIYQDLKEISNNLIKFINKELPPEEIVKNPLQNGDIV